MHVAREPTESSLACHPYSGVEYGYNREEITDYLRLCHSYLRPVTGGPSLDIIGARFGYRSRYDSLGDSEHDDVAELRDLVE
jgi:hypothetical protein